MTLSDKKLTAFREEISGRFYWEEDVKAFIKKLKEELDTYLLKEYVYDEIDKLAGEELTK